MRSVEELLASDEPLTYEDFQRLYYYEGLTVMIQRLKHQFPKQNKERLSLLIKSILYGYNKDGVGNDKPKSPDPYLMIDNAFLYNFQGKVWKRYVKKEMG